MRRFDKSEIQTTEQLFMANQPPTAELQALDAAHHLHPFTDHAQLHKRGTRVISRGEGIYIFDNEGARILDGMSGLWNVCLGYGRGEIIEAVRNQLTELPYYNTFFQCTHPPASVLAEKIAGVAPDGLDHVFFTSSGSEAIDTVVRMARHYWAVMGKPTKSILIGRENAYHGSTVAGASLGGMSAMHGQGGLPIPDIERIGQPYWFGEGGGMSPDEFGSARARELEQAIARSGEDRVAAFVAEPIQGAGGVIIPPDSYWPKIAEICARHEILLVADEVICGFGRLGTWFGAQHFGVRPDMMSFAKGVTSGYQPLGGVVVSGEIAATLIDKGGEFFHGFTYSGHPAACAAGIATLTILEQEGVIERVRDETGPYLKERWLELGDHPLVGEARMTGLIGALELVKAKEPVSFFDPPGIAGTMCRDFSIANGLVMRAVADRMVIAPPLVITPGEIDELIEKTRQSLDQTLEAVGRDGPS
ncbi:MAG: aspartate aminotransferase family protein [Rhizobiales bacterium]|nr:aspartate aminotransferase family protein [Hyphomicrobiales bacterium]